MTTNLLSRTLVCAVFLLAAARHATLHAEGANVLAISPVGGKSHWNFMRGILRALTDHGHRVTVFTPHPEGDRENYTEVDVSDQIFQLLAVDLDYVEEHLTDVGDMVSYMHLSSRNTCKNVYGHGAFRELTASHGAADHFDVVFTEILASECVAHLSTLLGDVPLVYVSTPPLVSYMERSVLGHHPNPAVVSNTFAGHNVPRTFLDRFTNTLLHCYTTALLRYNVWSVPERDRQPFDVPDPVKPSMVFRNAHYITDASRPMPPNVIPVGGIHLGPPKAIPQDILEFIENSPKGVIVFTLGSIVSISLLPMNIREAIIDVLGQVPQRVLMKYEKGQMPDLPTNIKTVKWLPQRDILMHPNVKLFISHGGISGIYEAVDAGIPVLGFPVFFDQSRNIENLVDAGMAISLKIKSLSKDTFFNAVTDLINNDKYKRNAKIAAERFKDRPMSPAQTIDYWTRYVIRHKGAPHLKSHALNLTWYQYFLLDVLGVLFLIILFILFVMFKFVELIKKLILGSTKSKSE